LDGLHEHRFVCCGSQWLSDRISVEEDSIEVPLDLDAAATDGEADWLTKGIAETEGNIKLSDRGAVESRGPMGSFVEAMTF
jgi:hypothetical protein